MAHAHYRLDEVICTVAGTPITEWTKGDAITVTYSDDDFKVLEGTHGATCRSGIPNTVGEVTLTVMQSSPVNQLLSDKHKLDKRLGTGAGPLLILDANGASFAIAEKMWCKKTPDLKMALEGSTVSWVYTCVGLDVNHGANLAV